MITNYFKVYGPGVHELVFFDDTALARISAAHQLAIAVKEEVQERFGLNVLGSQPIRISVYRKITVTGPWAGHHLIGEPMMSQDEFDALKRRS